MGFGFSEKFVVPERNCLKLDHSVSYEVGSLIFDNWGTPYSAISRTSMKAEDYVVVIGCGPIGLAAVRLAKLRGALAYDVLLRELHKLGRDIPVILEHLSGEEQYSHG
ncbi:hypothetical protein PBOR_13920 [Paenibacillus borealis]|uniref:Alcohol dehydrogenase-like C-terminal domain-containing protein n=1 Tax=Paenibacillus borealis TaxID=160799 RepID=A0A089LCX6_PAEBO|nr:hypothetical protein PBOR_13920 [Paenibacillus borealis]